MTNPTPVKITDLTAIATASATDVLPVVDVDVGITKKIQLDALWNYISTLVASNVNITGGAIAGITDIAVADGGTGSSTAAGARTNLGVAIGSDVQAYSARLAEIAALAVTDGNIIVGDGSAWVSEGGATARSSLGLGSIATQASDNVSITGGTLAGVTINAASTIDASVIGGSTPAAGTFTTLAGTTSVTTPLVTNAGTLALSATGANVITLSTNGTERARINSSGNVGIGVSSPQNLLHVKDAENGSASAYQAVVENANSGSGAAGVSFAVSSSAETFTPKAAITLERGAAQGAGTFRISVDASTDTNPVASTDAVYEYISTTLVHRWLSGGSERARFDSSGNLLIGTTTAGASKLVVADDSIQINTAKTPSSASDTGTTGEFAWDASYLYVCTATNTWRRVAHATW